jgi:two-component system, chemotaxis family, protein-glutamate methylesterase/glutaminase
LRKLEHAAAVQYRCHTGHIFGGGELLPAQIEMLEKALDVAQRVLSERIELARQMIEEAKSRGRQHGLHYWERVHAEAERQAATIRQVLPELAGNGHKLQEASK